MSLMTGDICEVRPESPEHVDKFSGRSDLGTK